jgi:hypothetical protein
LVISIQLSNYATVAETGGTTTEYNIYALPSSKHELQQPPYLHWFVPCSISTDGLTTVFLTANPTTLF